MGHETRTTDIIVIGGGIAGAGVAAAVAGSRRTLVLEREDRAGHHSTGRSAAIFIQNYGNAAIRALSRASAPLFQQGDPEFFPTPLLTPRGVLFVAGETALDRHAELLAQAEGLQAMDVNAAAAMVPILDRTWLRAAAYESDASDIDVNALHQGFLRQAARAGAALQTSAEILGGRRRDGGWRIDTSAGPVEAPIVVNASGAWADTTARLLGVAPLGLQPFRRSMAILPAPAGHVVRPWPLVSESAEAFYFKPDAGRLFVSPSEEDPVDPHDTYPDDLVLAEGLDRYAQAVTAPVERLLGSWAGLRTFAPDRTPVAGFDPTADGFFWLAGQGGYGIQTAPGLSRLAGALLTGAAPDAALSEAAVALDPARFR